MKKGKKNFHISNRLSYTLIIIGILLVASIGVYAYTVSGASPLEPNPGHNISQLQTCGSNGQTLIMSNGQWTCGAGSSGANVAVFTSTSTWTAPSGVTQILITGCGAGGNGGGADALGSGGNVAGGGGGGASTPHIDYPLSVTPGTQYTITAPAAGSNAAASVGNLLVMPAGGTGGQGHVSTNGGAGGGYAGGAGGSKGSGSPPVNGNGPGYPYVGGGGGGGSDNSQGAGGASAFYINNLLNIGGSGGGAGGYGCGAGGGGGAPGNLFVGSNGGTGANGQCHGGAAGGSASGYCSGGGGAGGGGGKNTPGVAGGAGGAGIVIIKW